MTGHRRGHDASWFQRTVERFEGQLVCYAAQLTGDADRARDVVQDTFLRLCREDPAELDGRLAPWLYAVCRNRALDVRKKESRMRQLRSNGSQLCASREPDHADSLETRDCAQRVSVILKELPENQQEVIRLKFQDGLSYREISHVTNLSVSNVGYLIHTGIRRIREQIVCQP